MSAISSPPAVGSCRRGAGDRPPAAVRRLVRAPRLGASPAPAGDGRGGRGRIAHPAGRAHRRRQDAGGVPAVADRTGRAGAETGDRAGVGGPHPLSVAAQGPDHRRRAQPDDPDPRDRAEHPRREPHRRHQTVQTPAPARVSARHPADHAGAAGPVLRLGGRAGLFRGPEVRGAGRGPRHLERQAGGSAVAWAGAPAGLLAGYAPRRPERDGRRSGHDRRVAAAGISFSPRGRRWAAEPLG